MNIALKYESLRFKFCDLRKFANGSVLEPQLVQVGIERVRNADFVRRRVQISLIILSHGAELVLNTLA